MNCPKCNGASYLSDEECVKVLESTSPPKIILRSTFVCNSCGERFSRVIQNNLEGIASQDKSLYNPAPGFPTSYEGLQPMQTRQPQASAQQNQQPSNQQQASSFQNMNLPPIQNQQEQEEDLDNKLRFIDKL